MFENLPYIVQGRSWQELPAGRKARTRRRTITESDLIVFVSATGMLEPLFTDAGHGGAIGGRPVPAALTYSLIEGLQLQSLVQGTGLALLEASMVVDAPVRVGDSVWATIEVADVRPTSRGNRAVVAFKVTVFNHSGEQVMHYHVKRLIAGREEEASTAP
jgi:3-hydroxybutyryl-CoA dehydratase